MEKDRIVELIAEELECKHEISKWFITTLLEAVKRFDKKQDIFTTENIADTGEIGLHTRISDRIAEIKKYLSVSEEKREELMLTDEKITKDFLDIGIYGFIGYIYRKGNWK
jgi:hypothetical protein